MAAVNQAWFLFFFSPCSPTSLHSLPRIPRHLSELLPFWRLLQDGPDDCQRCPHPWRFSHLHLPSAKWLPHVNEQHWQCRWGWFTSSLGSEKIDWFHQMLNKLGSYLVHSRLQLEPGAAGQCRMSVLFQPRGEHFLPGGQLRPQPEPRVLCLHGDIEQHWSKARFTKSFHRHLITFLYFLLPVFTQDVGCIAKPQSFRTYSGQFSCQKGGDHAKLNGLF